MKHLKTFTDDRGALTLLEVGQDVPFTVARVFWIHRVPQGQMRGGHAHKQLYQYIAAVSGSLDVCLNDGSGETVYHLDSPAEGLLLPPGVWKILRNFSPDAVALVLASQPYQPEDCIETYEEFLHYIQQ